MVCIVVPNESDIAAFKDYTLSADEAGAAPSAAPAAVSPQPAPTAASTAAPATSYPTHSVGMLSAALASTEWAKKADPSILSQLSCFNVKLKVKYKRHSESLNHF